jgi:hypothetical protein
MFRLFGRALVALAATATAVGVGVGPVAAAPVAAPAAAVATTRAPVAEPRLVDVDFQQRRGSDRLVFRFRGGVPDDVRARLVRVVRDDDGDRVRLPGRFFVVLRFVDANGRGFDSDVIDADLRNVRAIRLIDDGRRSDDLRVALGLRQRADVRIFESRNRIIVDVDRRFRR